MTGGGFSRRKNSPITDTVPSDLTATVTVD
jgi:hypothetical protein